MEKDKILALSREENKKRDEGKLFVERQSYANGFIAIEVLVCVFYLYQLLFFEDSKQANFLFGPSMLGFCIFHLTSYYYSRRIINLIGTIFFGIGAVVFIFDLFIGRI